MENSFISEFFETYASSFSFKKIINSNYALVIFGIMFVASAIFCMIEGVNLKYSFFKDSFSIKEFFNSHSIAWKVFAVISISIISVTIVVMVVSLVKLGLENLADKAEEKRNQKMWKEQEAEKERKKIELLTMVILAKNAILLEPGNSWKEILFVAKNRRVFPSIFLEIISKIPLAPLNGVIIVSKIKKQIVWNDDLPEALKVLEYLTGFLYEDKSLQSLLDQVSAFTSYLLEFKDYVGYDKLMSQIEVCCPMLLGLINSPVK